MFQENGQFGQGSLIPIDYQSSNVEKTLSDQLSKMSIIETEWQLNCSVLTQRGAHLLQSGLFSDCSFLLRGQVTVKGHKMILAMASPVFCAMLYGEMSESKDPMHIVDMEPEVFKALLEYIYADKVVTSSFDMAFNLYHASKKYMLPHLVKKCSTYISSHLSSENACRVYELARMFDDITLMDNCLQIISLNTKEVLNNDSFLEIDVKTMARVFTLEQMNIESEIELVEAAARYLKALENTEEKRISTESSSNVEDDKVLPQCSSDTSTRANIDTKLTVKDALKQIRFLTLTPQQFAGCHAQLSQPGMLTDSEFYAVLMNISSTKTNVAMPDGFSTTRLTRNSKTGNNSSGGLQASVHCKRVWVPTEGYYGDKYCYVTFAADRDVELLGVEIPSQMSNNNSRTYTEDVTVRVWKADDTNYDQFMVDVEFAKEVAYHSLIDIRFQKPCPLTKNEEYVILVQLHALGRYPRGRAALPPSAPPPLRVLHSEQNENDDLLRSFIIRIAQPTILPKPVFPVTSI